MQHELMRHPAPTEGSDNVGDVLASIRRLIAQDGTDDGTTGPISGHALNAVPQPSAYIRSAPVTGRMTPLVLDRTDLIAPEPESTEPDLPEAAGIEAAADDPAPLQLLPQVESPAGTVEDLALSPLPESAPDTGIEPFGTSDDEPSIIPMQIEETMLTTNAPVNPFNPAAAAQDPANLPYDRAEARPAASDDRGMQKNAHLRGMIREAIRQELRGEIDTLGRNLQAVIQQEVEQTLRQMCELG